MDTSSTRPESPTPGTIWLPGVSITNVVAFGTGGARASSIDGVNWASTPLGGASITAAVYSPELGIMVAVGNELGKPYLASSPSGVDDWSRRYTTYAGSEFLNAVAWSPALSLFVAAGNTVSYTSTDGKTWTVRGAISTSGVNAIAWSAELGLFVAVGAGKIATSPDGATWTARTSPTPNVMYSISWSPTVALFVVTGTSGVILTSPDGVTWTAGTYGTTTFRGGAWSSDLGLFIIGLNSTPGVLSTSPDGVTWTDHGAVANSVYAIVAARVTSPRVNIFTDTWHDWPDLVAP